MNPSPDVPDRPARVLIVDDEPANRQLLVAMLTPEGFVLPTAASGEEALAIVAREPPDLILLDVMMPDMDGNRVVAKIKGNPDTKHIPVIMLSALADRDSRILGLSAGAEDFLTKPVDRAELTVRVRNLLGLKAYGDYYGKYSETLRKAKEEAESANRAKSEFLSRMSHELRTPLNAIIGFSQVLEVTETSEKNRPRVGHILKAGRHLLGLIEEVLDISRIEARLLSLSVEPVLVGAAVAQAVDLVQPTAANAGVTLEIAASAEDALYVSADRQRIQQILLNLLSNAIKYNSSGGTVTMSVGVVSGKMRVYVTDTGIGISEKYFSKLFQPFERLGATHTGVQGTGLGLALSKGLAEAMGGAIGVESVVGQGTTFWLELTLADSPSQAIRRETAPIFETPIPGEFDHTVLYIEDNLSNVQVMEEIVALRPGITLVTAMQGGIGLDLARENRPELIFLDVHLPDLMGHEVLSRLKSDPRTSTIPVIIISADATKGQVSRLLDLGAEEYLTKPIDMKQLFRVFNEHLSKPDERPLLEKQSL